MRKALGIFLLMIGTSAIASACVPEIDPASAGSVIALVSGGLLILGSGHKRY